MLKYAVTIPSPVLTNAKALWLVLLIIFCEDRSVQCSGARRRIATRLWAVEVPCSVHEAVGVEGWLKRSQMKLSRVAEGWEGCHVRTTIDLSEMVHDEATVKFCTTLGSLWWTYTGCRVPKHAADGTRIRHKRGLLCSVFVLTIKKIINSMASVRKRTTPTEGPLLVSEVSANFLRIEGATWSGWRIPTDVFSPF
jgi:hypothetical protein